MSLQTRGPSGCPCSLCCVSPFSHTRRSQKLPGSTETPKSPLPGCGAAVPIICLFFFLLFFYSPDPCKGENSLGWKGSTRSGAVCRGGCFVFVDAAGEPRSPLGAPFGHRQLGEKLESKGQRGKEERLEPSWKRGRIPHPAPVGAGDEEASPADGFSGGCSEFFSVGTA